MLEDLLENSIITNESDFNDTWIRTGRETKLMPDSYRKQTILQNYNGKIRGLYVKEHSHGNNFYTCG